MPLISIDDENYILWALLHTTRHASYAIRKRELSSLGILPRWVAAVQSIQRLGDSATPSEIAKLLFRSRNSVSQLLVRMEKEGLITKTKDLAKKNNIRVRLTEKGMQVYKLSLTSDSINRAFSYLSEEQRQQIESALQTLMKGVFKELGLEWESSPAYDFLYGDARRRLKEHDDPAITAHLTG